MRKSLHRLAGTALVASSTLIAASLVAPVAVAGQRAEPAAPHQRQVSIGRTYPAGATAAADAQPTEVPGLRTALSNTFDLGDGRYRTASFSGPVNYRDPSGALLRSLCPGHGRLGP